MTNEFKFGKTIDNATWESLKKTFKDRNGYMSKVINKAIKHGSNVAGYLVRAEVPAKTDKDTVIVAFSFVPNLETFNNAKFLKSIAMNKVITGANRKLSKLTKNKNINELENDNLINYFSNPLYTANEALAYFKTDDNSFTYKHFYEYVKEFENKINKYYTNKKIIKIVI